MMLNEKWNLLRVYVVYFQYNNVTSTPYYVFNFESFSSTVNNYKTSFLIKFGSQICTSDARGICSMLKSQVTVHLVILYLVCKACIVPSCLTQDSFHIRKKEPINNY